MNMALADTWMSLTNLGAATVSLPMVPAIMLGLWLEKRQRVVAAWLTALSIGVLIVLISKIAFIGWGLGIASLDFTGVSGHTFLASAILPVVFAWFPLPRKLSLSATILGVCLAILVGWSRIVLGAHSLSEVVAGWCLGAMVGGTALALMHGMKSNQPDLSAMHGFVVLALLAMFSMSQSAAVSMPMHPLEVRLALKLSGHDHPFNRLDLHRRAGI